MKIYFLFYFLLSFNLTIAHALQIDVRYTEHADVLHFIDNISGFHGEHVHQSYSDFWKLRGMQLDNDLYYMDSFAKSREKYYKINNYILSRSDSGVDKIAEYFFKTDSLEEALEAIKSIVDLEDYHIIESCIKHFYVRVKEIINSRDFKKESDDIQKYLQSDNGIRYLNLMSNFYNVNPQAIVINLVWTPNANASSSYQFSDIVVMKQSENSEIIEENYSIIMHEIAHYFSSLINENDYERYRKMLIQSTEIEKNYFCKNNNLLLESPLLAEEPLAVAIGQMYYLQTFVPDRFNLFEEFYNNPWVNVISKLIYPMVWHYLSNNKPMDDIFIFNLGKMITQTFSLACSDSLDVVAENEF